MLAAKHAADCADPQLLRKAVAAQEVADSRIIRPDQWPAWAAGIRPSRPVVESPGAVDNAE
jgi:hypothetical protein